MANIIYLDEATNQIKSSNDYDFDELFMDLDDPPPNAKILRAHFFGHEPPTIEQPASTPEIMALDHPFLSLKKHTITRTCDHPTFGLCFLEDDLNRRAHVKEIFQQTSASALKFKQRDILGAYVVAINTTPVYTLQEVNRAISEAHISDTPEVVLTLAPHSYQNPLDDEHLPVIQDNQVRLAIHQLCTIPMGEEIVTNDNQALFIHQTTVHEASQTEQSSHLLENTSTLAGDYVVLPTHEPTPLPSLTFEHHFTPYDPVISHNQINQVKTSSNDSTSSNSTSSSFNLDWTDTGFTIHRLKESPQTRIDRINNEVKHSVVKGRFVRTSLINGLSREL